MNHLEERILRLLEVHRPADQQALESLLLGDDAIVQGFVALGRVGGVCTGDWLFNVLVRAGFYRRPN